MKNLFLIIFFLTQLSCTKAMVTGRTIEPKLYKQTFSATANDLYYALRWALKTYDYPIVEEDLQNGVIKTRFVPVKSNSHYVAIFKREDYGAADGAYHQLEVRLVPKSGKTEVQVGSRVQAIVQNVKSAGREERFILGKLADYLRSPNAKVTNIGVQE